MNERILFELDFDGAEFKIKYDKDGSLKFVYNISSELTRGSNGKKRYLKTITLETKSNRKKETREIEKFDRAIKFKFDDYTSNGCIRDFSVKLTSNVGILQKTICKFKGSVFLYPEPPVDTYDSPETVYEPPVDDRQPSVSESELREERLKYEELNSLAGRLKGYRIYRNLFFEVEKSLREIIGIFHYNNGEIVEFHDAERMSEVIKTVFVNETFPSIHHAGIDISTGKPFYDTPQGEPPADPNELSYQSLKSANKSIEEQIDDIKEYQSFFEFWEKLFPLIKQYQIYLDENIPEKFSFYKIKEDFEQIERFIGELGYQIVYSEYFDGTEDKTLSYYYTDAFSYPALYRNGKLITNCQGSIKREESFEN